MSAVYDIALRMSSVFFLSHLLPGSNLMLTCWLSPLLLVVVSPADCRVSTVLLPTVSRHLYVNIFNISSALVSYELSHRQTVVLLSVESTSSRKPPPVCQHLVNLMNCWPSVDSLASWAIAFVYMLAI